LLTGHGNYEIDLLAMKAGATDYLSKGETTPLLLERAIRYAIEHKQHEEALVDANRQLANAKSSLGDARARTHDRTAAQRTKIWKQRSCGAKVWRLNWPNCSGD
jgi:FixJ family two-component response regulator